MDIEKEFEFFGNEIKKIAGCLKSEDISIASFILGGLHARCVENCIKHKNNYDEIPMRCKARFTPNERTEK